MYNLNLKKSCVKASILAEKDKLGYFTPTEKNT